MGVKERIYERNERHREPAIKELLGIWARILK